MTQFSTQARTTTMSKYQGLQTRQLRLPSLCCHIVMTSLKERNPWGGLTELLLMSPDGFKSLFSVVSSRGVKQ